MGWWWDKHSLLNEMCTNVSTTLLYLLLVYRALLCNKQKVFFSSVECLYI